VTETQALLLDRCGDAWPGGGFLGHHHYVGMALAHGLVELAQEAHRFQVLATALGVGQPFALGTAVIAVEHRGHGIDAQAVDVETLDPLQRAGDQERGDFGAAVVVDQGVPVRVQAQARVVVLVQRSAVEALHAMGIAGEMRANPVQDHTEARGVAAVDEAREASGEPCRAVGANMPRGW
jgi:hypothetical protein